MLSSPALWPTGNSSVAQGWAMAHRLKNSVLGRGKFEFIKPFPSDSAEVKCMVRMTYVAITRRRVWGANPPRLWYGNTNFSPPYLNVLPTLLHKIMESNRHRNVYSC